LAAIFGSMEKGQVTYMAPDKGLAVKLLDDAVKGTSIKDIIQSLNPNRNIHNLETLYQSYNENPGNTEIAKKLYDALNDPNGFLIIGTHTHGSIAHKAQTDPDLMKTRTSDIDGRRHLLTDEVHKLTESMSFILGESSDITLGMQDPTSIWAKS